MNFNHKRKTILIAPSWQKDNIVDLCLEELLDNLKDHEYQIIVRPHPQQVRLMPKKMELLKQKYKNNSEIIIQTDFSSNSTVFEADALISDWSDIAVEYAFTTCKPVLFVDTPMKIMNPEYKDIQVEPFNIRIRNIIGKSLCLDNLDKTYATIKDLIEHADAYRTVIEDLVHDEIYHLNESSNIGGAYIANRVIERCKGDNERDESI